MNKSEFSIFYLTLQQVWSGVTLGETLKRPWAEAEWPQSPGASVLVQHSWNHCADPLGLPPRVLPTTSLGYCIPCAWHSSVLPPAPFSLHAGSLVSRQAQLKSTPLLEGTKGFWILQCLLWFRTRGILPPPWIFALLQLVSWGTWRTQLDNFQSYVSTSGFWTDIVN